MGEQERDMADSAQTEPDLDTLRAELLSGMEPIAPGSEDQEHPLEPGSERSLDELRSEVLSRKDSDQS